MNHLSKRNITGESNISKNWRQIRAGSFSANQLESSLGDRAESVEDTKPESSLRSALRRRNIFTSSSNFVYALLITIFIICTQLFIVHHYVGDSAGRQRLFNAQSANREASLLVKADWFCHSFSHLNRIADLALQFQVELVIVDLDLLDLLLNSNDKGSNSRQPLEFSYSGNRKQESSHKTVIHLAAINETSGGQPNLALFYDALKEHYHLLKYNDASETMAAEVYKRESHELDDVHSDAIQDARRPGEGSQESAFRSSDFEISKIYTEFMTHLFILNSTRRADQQSTVWDSPIKCSLPPVSDEKEPFIVVHLFVLYNYEFQPEDKWIQSSLMLNEIERHKLLSYGVHLVDFKVMLNHYYVHNKRKSSTLLEASTLKSPLKFDRPLNRIKIFEPDHFLEYANNTYLHCKRSPFNISALRGESVKMSAYLKTLDGAKPLKSSKYRSLLMDQLAVGIQFMNVFSRSYGNFSYWLTGSTLLAYHRFCQLIAVTPSKVKEGQFETETEDDLMLLSIDDYEEEALDDKTMLDFELGLFESELNMTMLNDLSQANMIGVTMISDWRERGKNDLVSFRISDCPNLVFNLHFYQLEQDFYQRFYITKDNMIYNHKLKRRKSPPTTQKSAGLSQMPTTGHHVFTTKDLELCWTRLDHLEPFRVPCDVHEHLRRIYVV